MKKIVLTFGIIAGLIPGGIFFFNIPDENSAQSMFENSNGELIGYASMIIALSTIFFAVKQYRDKHLDGKIKFGKAFLIGIYITLIAGAIYVFAWEIYYTNFASDFGQLYVEHIKSKMVESGKSELDISKEITTLEEQMALYDNNILVRLAFTFMEIFPVGFAISLICGAIFGVFLKPKHVEVA